MEDLLKRIKIKSIEFMGINNTVDIEVDVDNLFLSNGILTHNSSDVDLTNTSESFGLPATADFMFAIVATDELDELGQLMIKQLKNRYNDLSQNKNFVIGVDRAKMRLYDVEASAQATFDRPVMDNSEYGQRYDEEENMRFATKTRGRKDFSKMALS